MRANFAVLALCLLTILGAAYVLETSRSGIDITHQKIGQSPVTVYDGEGPDVVVAHGFAGSRQMMQAYALSLAQSGYRVWVFDFEGHGRHPVPMSGDVNAIDGTTQLLVQQTLDIVDATEAAEPVAMLGHSMATDILIRARIAAPDRIGPLVVISAFSQAVDAQRPPNMLMVTGAWESGLREFARQAVRMVDPGAVEGDLAQLDGVRRKAVVAPMAEHVGVLHSRVGRSEAIDWLNAYYGREQVAQVAATGPATLLLLLALVALAKPASRLLPQQGGGPRASISIAKFAALAVVPAVLAPPLAVLIDPRALPVLVADHLAVHLAIYGLIQLGFLRAFGVRFGRVAPLGVLFLLVWGLMMFGGALDRYAANFVPIPERMLIILALALGAVPFMLADALATEGGQAPVSRRVVLRVAFLVSLGFAVALDFEGLFFLIMIAPVIVLFYALFGLVGRWVAQRQGAMAAGIGLGLCLAWSLGVSFPMFAGG